MASLFLLAGVAGSQAQNKKDAQSSFEPRSDAGTGQKFLEAFVGNWDVVKTFYPRSGDPVKQTGECHQTMMHEGRFLRSEFVFQEDKSKTTGLGIIGFEADNGRFTSVWTDSRSTRISLRQSRDKFDGNEIVLFSQTLGEAGKEARVSRTLTRLEDKGNTILHRQFVPGPEGKERVMMELKMTRKKD
jgi:hypothetical protein